MKFVLAVITITIGLLLLECWKVGFSNSSLRRLLNPSPTEKEDLWYFVISITSVSRYLSILFSFGFGYIANYLIETYCKLHLIEIYSYATQLFIIVIIDSFIGYWKHRLLHTICLWNIHKVHHSATEFNFITSARNHPLDSIITLVSSTFILTMIGGAPIVLMAYGLFNIVYQYSVHSNLNWGHGWFGRYILINPSRHMIHHASESKYWNKNFSSLSIWDHIFGTYMEPEDHKISLGFIDDKAHNHGIKNSLIIPFIRLLKLDKS